MKVLFVCSGNASHGVAPFVKSQGDSLVAAGVELEYFLIRGRGAWGYLKNVPPLSSRIRGGGFDLIHAHYSLSGAAALLAARGRVPVVLSFMGGDIDSLEDENFRRSPAGLINAALARWGCRKAAAIIVKSPSLMAHVPPEHRPKCRIIPNGVDLDRFAPRPRAECRQELGLSPDRRYVLFLGNPEEPRKGFALLKAAMERVGDQAELLVPYRLDHERVPLYINASDLLVLASSSEGSPNVVKEAMACDLPVVSTEVGDVVELLEGLRNCRVVQRDAEILAAAIRDSLREGGRSGGRKKIRSLSLDAVAGRVITLYGEALRHAP